MNNQTVGQTLIIIKGDFCYRAGRTFVAGDSWIRGDNLRMLICCACLSGVFIYTPILFEDFRYTLSRMRCPVKDIQKKGDMSKGVFMNMEGVWFGKEQVVDTKSFSDLDFKIDLAELQNKYEGYWNG